MPNASGTEGSRRFAELMPRLPQPGNFLELGSGVPTISTVWTAISRFSAEKLERVDGNDSPLDAFIARIARFLGFHQIPVEHLHGRSVTIGVEHRH